MAKRIEYMQGWRRYAVCLIVCLGLFLSDVELTIVSTALITVSNSLNDFNLSSWVVTSYLISFTGFLMVIAKLSDIYGRKTMMLISIFIFTVFSIACGVARNMTQLVVFRALQGIGGGGMHSLSWAIFPELIPSEKFPLYSVVISSSFVFSALLGPLIGGAITNDGDWRWVFLFNGPVGAVMFLLVLVVMPWNYPFLSARTRDVYESFNSKAALKTDFVGAFLLLAATVLCVTALEQGGTILTWSDKLPAIMLNNALWLFAVFAAWQWYLSKSNSSREPIMPWRILTNRFTMGTLLNSFLVCGVLFTLIIEIPLKLQLANGLSPLNAGYKLLVLTLMAPVGGGVAGQLIEKCRVPPLYILLAGTVLQALGVGLMISLPVDDFTIRPEFYGFQVLAGIGIGLCVGAMLLLLTITFEPRDFAVAAGAQAQFRFIGAALILSICTNVLKNRVDSELGGILSSSQIGDLLRTAQTIENLPPVAQQFARRVYALAFRDQLVVMTIFSGLAVVACLILVEKKPRVADPSRLNFAGNEEDVQSTSTEDVPVTVRTDEEKA